MPPSKPNGRWICTFRNKAPRLPRRFVRRESAPRAPQNRGGCVPAGPVRFSRREPPWRTMFAATVSAGCKRLAARLPQHPPFGIRPQPCSGAQRAPQNADPPHPRAPCAANPPPCSGAQRAPQNRGGCVPAGPVRFSRREPPWRTMFAATVSAGCKHLAARLPQHPPFGIRPQPCSGAQRAPQNADPPRTRRPVAAHSVRHKMRTRRESAANPHPDTTAKEEPP